MEKLRIIVTRAMKSIDRITNAPVALVMKMLSVMGITRTIKMSMFRAIRKDRLMRASIILLSPALITAGVFIGYQLFSGSAISAARGSVAALGAILAVVVKYRRMQRLHLEKAVIREMARRRRLIR